MKLLPKIITFAAAMFFVVNARAQLTAPMNFPLPPNLSAANVSAAEYYFDTDPGFGNGTSIPVTTGNDVSVSNFSVAISALSSGAHRLYVRVKNTSGQWSLSNVANLFIIPQGALFPENAVAVNVSTAEYFIDNDPGFGMGTNIPITAGADVTANNIAVDISSLATGAHRIYVRVKNANGNWSLANVASFYMVQGSALFPANAGVANVSSAEYFLDNDPGFGNGTSIPITAGADVSANNIAVDIGSLATGVHRIYVRTQNTNGNWSLANVATFYIEPISFTIPPNATPGNITALEYFFDTDPGFGNGTMISIPPTTDLSNYQFAADISTLQQDTTHTLYVRALDGWSQTTITTFKIGGPLSLNWLSFTGKLQQNHTVFLQWQTATEANSNHFEIERSGNGKDFAAIGQMAASDSSGVKQSYSFTDLTPLSGTDYYRIKQVYNDGNNIYSPVLPVNVNAAQENDFYIINNPARSVLRVYIGNHDGKAQLQLLDMDGRQMLQAKVTPPDIQQIEVAGLPSGMYLVQYLDGNEKTSRRFVKE